MNEEITTCILANCQRRLRFSMYLEFIHNGNWLPFIKTTRLVGASTARLASVATEHSLFARSLGREQSKWSHRVRDRSKVWLGLYSISLRKCSFCGSTRRLLPFWCSVLCITKFFQDFCVLCWCCEHVRCLWNFILWIRVKLGAKASLLYSKVSF